MLQLFGDVATELLIINDGDEGLFCAYDNVEFLAPVFAGDYIEAVGEITSVGNSSRKMKFEARKVIAPRTDISAFGLVLAMACLLVIGALALWRSRRETGATPAFF